jgi:hypothetical protein
MFLRHCAACLLFAALARVAGLKVHGAVGRSAGPLGGGTNPSAKSLPAGAIAWLIAQLGDATFGLREEAGQRLVQIGDLAIAPLRQAARTSRDAEVRGRAADLARRIALEVRGELLTFGEGGAYELNRGVNGRPTGARPSGCKCH